MGLEVAPPAPVPSPALYPNGVRRDIRRDERLMFTSATLLAEHKLLRVENTGKFYYYRPEEGIYRPLSHIKFQGWVRDILLESFGELNPNLVGDCIETTKLMVRDSVPEVDHRYLGITPKFYWDTREGVFTEEPLGPVFHRFFDTQTATTDIGITPPFSPELVRRLKKKHEQVREHLEKTGDIKEEFPFITTWACHRHSVYLDMIRAIGYSLMEKKPLGSYILIGIARNGKSTYLNMLHWLFGTENTTRLRMEQLADHHHAIPLSTTLLNAPDEEKEIKGGEQAMVQTVFKTLAAHGDLTATKMFSQESMKIRGNFMSFFPMNHLPDWKGMGAGACVKRSLILPFYADLSRYDAATSNFMYDTFTPEVMADLLGTVTGIAAFYTHHPFEFSDAMRDEQGSIEEDVDNVINYRREFELFFDGFSSRKVLYEDYRNWCGAHDLYAKNEKEFAFVFREYTSRERCQVRTSNGKRVKVYRVPRKDKLVLRPGVRYDTIGYLEDLHKNTRQLSLVERMDNYYRDKFGDGYAESIRKRDAKNSTVDDNFEELEQMKWV